MIGGVCIGVYRVETKEYLRRIIAPEFFQGVSFAQKAYHEEGAFLVRQCFAHLEVSGDEEILCCTGHVLDGIYDWLTRCGYLNVTRGKITGMLQQLVEQSFLDYLETLGFTVDYDLLTMADKKGLFWYNQVKWLKGGNANAQEARPDRVTLCKSGWRSFSIWAGNSYHKAEKNSRRRRRSSADGGIR